jgi:GTP-binding protein
MGTRFLKHIERTRILVHLIDVSVIEEQHPLRVYETILQELSHYNRKLAQKPQMLVLNKMDLPGSLQKASVFEAALAGGEVYKVSALTRQGLKELISALSGMLAHLDGLGDTSPG